MDLPVIDRPAPGSLVLPLAPLGKRLTYARRAGYRFRRAIIRAVERSGAKVKAQPEYVAVHVAAAVECMRRYYAVGKALADRGQPTADADVSAWLAMNDRVIRYLESAAKHLRAIGLDQGQVDSWFSEYVDAFTGLTAGMPTTRRQTSDEPTEDDDAPQRT